MQQNIKSIMVVGGGSAGWMAAGYFAVKGFDVTLIESPDIGIVGVGESTVPAINWLANEMGMQEHEWMPLAHATFKMGIRHLNWNAPGHEWWHWFLYNRTMNDQQRKYIETDTLPPRDLLQYGYHVDAFTFGEAICKTAAIKHSCKHIVDHIEHVIGDPESGIDALITKTGQKLQADFYIDCSGWRKILAKTVGMKYTQYVDHVNNRAVAAPQPKISDARAQVTTTRAQNIGWTWDIPLSHRRGCGYVYASDFLSDDEAVEIFCQQFPDTDRSKINFLKFQPEVCVDSIKKNVAVAGLSGGFLEPLEATSLFLTFFMVRQAYKHASQGRNQQSLNRNLVKVFDYIAAFVLGHYVLSENNTNEYWRYYKNLASKDRLVQSIHERAAYPDTMAWHERNLFFPYSWWALLNGYGVPQKT